MTYFEAVHKAQGCLRQQHVPDADVDALMLLQFICGITREEYYLRQTEEMAPEMEEAYWTCVRKRASRIPLQQITGEQYFMGLSFRVTEDVLSPRQDTELLAEEALRRIRPGERVLDLCTGSGCILVSMLALGDRLTGTGADISEDALRTARYNARRHHVRAALVQSDLCAQVTGIYDMIVSNPPYIASGEIGQLMEEVRDHEPRIALDGGPDGLAFYRRILPQSREHLREGGWLLTEIGCDQANAVRSMFIDHRYEETEVLQDLGGHDRVVLGRKASV